MRIALTALPPTRLAQLRRYSFLPLVALVLIAAAFVRTQLNGDGIEYLTMTHAFAKHGSPAPSPRDVEQVAQALGETHPAAQGLTRIHEELARIPARNPHHGFARNDAGEVYAIHFWFYSLLAAPFYALVAAAGLNLFWSFAILNLLLVGATLWHLRRSLSSSFDAAAVVFAALGTVYYVGWTGPEILAGCCAFSAAICMLRRDTSVAILLCGLGATQNPSLVLLIPVVLAHRLCTIRFPALVPLARVERSLSAELLLGAAGLFAALSSQLFYYAKYGVPSIITLFSTDTRLISLNRAKSFLFDLNIGMLAGMPGVFAGLLLVLVARSRSGKGRGWNALVLAGAAVAIAAPTLAAVNWNNGTSAVMRYGYWAAMPVVACIAAYLPTLSSAWRTALVATVVLAQGLAIFATGWLPGSSVYLQQTRAARWALAHAPSLYNPDPEIFFERGWHREAAFDERSTYLYRDGGTPTKFLRHWTNTADNAGLCPKELALSSDDIVEVDRGWQYLNAPLRCAPPVVVTAPLRFSFSEAGAAGNTLASGWSTPEAGGTWSIGNKSVIRIDIPSGAEVLAVHVSGFYFHPIETSEVWINGQALGEMSLADGKLGIPATLRRAPVLTIELVHPTTYSPARLGPSGDGRELAYHIKELRLQTRRVQ